MPLRIRRGSNAERLEKTFAMGELVYVTDEQKLVVGDGTTQGGIVVSTDVDVQAVQNTTANMFTEGQHTNIGFAYDAQAGIINATVDLSELDLVDIEGIIRADGFQGSIFLDDSTLFLDADLGIVFFDNVDVEGIIRADGFQGSIFLDDSTQFLDTDLNVVLFENVVTSGDIIPEADTVFDIGNPDFQYATVHASQLRLEENIISTFNDVVTIDGEEVLIENGQYSITIIADDSTIMVDPETGVLSGVFLGDVVSEDGSTIIIDAANNIGQFNIVNSESIFVDSAFVDTANFTTLITGSIDVPQVGKLSLRPVENNQKMDLILQGNEDESIVRLVKTSSGDLTGVGGFYGLLTFERVDVNESLRTSTIGGAEELLFFAADPTGEFTDPSKWMGLRNGLLGIGSINPEEKLDVHGNCIIRGNIVADNFVQFGSLTTTQRNNLTATNGMVIYNSTDNKFQGYADGNWIDLH